MRTLVNHVQAVVTPVLLHREIARVTVAPMDLDRQRIGFQAPLAGPALGNRRQHFQQQPSLVRSLGRTGMLFIDQARAVQLERQRTFTIGLLRQQHALDVGVLDDANLRLRRVLAACRQCPALRPVLCVVQRGVVASQAQHGGGNADADTRLVHHVEHAAQALTGFAHQIAHGAGMTGDRVLALAKIEQCVDRATPAQLVIETGQCDVVAFPGEFTGHVHHLLGHDEERDAARAGNQLAVRPRYLGQHQVNDVLVQFVLAG